MHDVRISPRKVGSNTNYTWINMGFDDLISIHVEENKIRNPGSTAASEREAPSTNLLGT